MKTIEQYDALLAAERENFFSGTSFASLDKRATVYKLLHLYANGVKMTEPVPYWIKRAAQRSKELGFDKTGEALEMHADHEAGHHKLYESDFNTLRTLWKEDSGEEISIDLLTEKSWNVVKDYIHLHEDIINSPFPYCQVAIELEIEGVSSKLGAHMMDHIAETLGEKYIKAMSFVEEHAEIDVGHTRFNRGLLSELLKDPRVDFNKLVSTGIAALRSFKGYIQACHQAAEAYSVLEPNSRVGASFADKKEAVSFLVQQNQNNLFNGIDIGELFSEAAAHLKAEQSFSKRFES